MRLGPRPNGRLTSTRVSGPADHADGRQAADGGRQAADGGAEPAAGTTPDEGGEPGTGEHGTLVMGDPETAMQPGTTTGADGPADAGGAADVGTVAGPGDAAAGGAADAGTTAEPGGAGEHTRRTPRWAGWRAGRGRPGWNRLVRGAGRWWRARDLAGRAFAVVTLLPPLLLTAWLIPGIVLLLAGRFVPVPMLLIASPVAVALVMLCARDIPGSWPKAGRRPALAELRDRPWTAWWGLGGTVAVAVGFAVWQLAVNSPQLIVTRDPGAYLQSGYWIAQHGSLPIPVSLAAFGGSHPGLTFSSFGFTSHGWAVAPRFMAGLPITLAAGLWAHGIAGGTVVSAVLGGLAVLAVGGLTGRLAGPQWAPLGAVLLALTVPEVYTSRSAFSETLVQALLFGGLCLVVDSLTAKRPGILAATGGLVLGLTTLAWAGSPVVLLPLIMFTGVLLAGRRRQGIPLGAGVLVGAGLGIGSGFTLGVPFLAGATLSPLATGIAAAVFAVVTGAGVAVWLVGRVRRQAVRLLAERPLRWLPEAGAVAVAGVAIAFAVRPYVQTVRGPANPYVEMLQRLLGLPVDPGRLYAEESLYWLIWYLGVPVLLLGIYGMAILTQRCLRALLHWRDPNGVARTSALPLAVTGWSFLAVLWQPATVPDQPWASRRLVPVLLPGLVVLAVWVSAWLITRAQRRGAGAVAVGAAAACFVAALALPPAAITFEIGPWHRTTPAVRTALTGLAFRRTGAGEYGADLTLCGALGTRATAVLLDQPAARGFAQVIRGMCGVPAGVAASASTARVEAVIAGIERAGRRPVLLASRSAELMPYQAHPQLVVNLLTQQDTHVLTQPPTSTWPADYQLWMAAPGGTAGSFSGS